jgi:hypothetical protein
LTQSGLTDSFPDVVGDELDREQAILLPDREALSLIDITNIVGINLALAVNAATIGSAASAAAIQGAISTQF